MRIDFEDDQWDDEPQGDDPPELANGITDTMCFIGWAVLVFGLLFSAFCLAMSIGGKTE